MPTIKRVLIEGNQVKVIKETVVGTCSVDEFLSSTAGMRTLDTGILPQNTRYYRVINENLSVYLLEIPPGVRTINYKNVRAGAEAPNEELRISLPYLHFVFACNPTAGTILNQLLAATKVPFAALNSPISFPPLTNVYEQGKICWGNVRDLNRFSHIHQKVQFIVGDFFRSQFNLDLDYGKPSSLSRRTTPWMRIMAEESASNSLWGISDAVTYRNHPSETFEGLISGVIPR